MSLEFEYPAKVYGDDVMEEHLLPTLSATTHECGDSVAAV